MESVAIYANVKRPEHGDRDSDCEEEQAKERRSGKCKMRYSESSVLKCQRCLYEQVLERENASQVGDWV